MYQAPKKSSTKLMKIYQAIGIVLLCIVLCVLSYKVTLAWFVDESITSNGRPNILVVGTVDLSVETHFNFYNLVLAPDTLYTENIEDGKAVSYATRIRTSNDNDTGTIYVRAKFTTNRPELTLHFNKFTDATTYNDDLEGYWCYNSSDQYYYYLGEVGSTDIIFNSGYYVDNTLNNSKANADVEINFVFESIQRPYGAYHAVWKSAPGIFDSFASSNSGYVESTP